MNLIKGSPVHKVAANAGPENDESYVSLKKI